MFIDVNYNRKPQKAKLQLAKPDMTVISSIYEKFNDSLNLKSANISELKFSIPHFIDGVENEHVEMIKEKMLIKVTMGSFTEYYVVDEIEEDGDEVDVFNVTAFSLPYENRDKRISGLVEEDGINATMLLTKILENSLWTIGTVDPIFDEMYRSFDSGDDTNILDCIFQASETFGALIKWDSINRKVSFLDVTKDGKFKGMTVNYGRFLRSIKRLRTLDEMTTRLYIEGSEGLTIHGVNPTGQGYIEDFSYFMYPFERDANKNVIKSSAFMSDALCHAILDNRIISEAKAPEIKALTDQLVIKMVALSTEETALNELELELETILGLLDTAKSTEDQPLIDQRTLERDAKNDEILAQKIVIGNIENEIENINTQIQSIQDQIDAESNFTPQLAKELKYYIIEKTWKDDRYIDAQELFDDGVKKFIEMRQPKVVIEATIDNLLSIVEEQYYWDKLVLGDYIKVKYPQMNIEYMAKIIEINYDLENDEVTLVIANTTDLLSDTQKLVQLLNSNSSASSLIQNNKYKWDKINAVEKDVISLLTSEWDANKNKIIAGVRNTVEVGNRGIIIKNPDYPNEVVIMQAGIIALSKDGGETWKTAIKPDGIVAERLIGQIIAGQELFITNTSGSFTLDNNGARFTVGTFVIESANGSNLVDKFISASNFVDEIIDDNMVTAYEKKILKDQFSKIENAYNSNVNKINFYWEASEQQIPEISKYFSDYTILFDYLFTINHGDKPLLASNNMEFTTRIDRDEFSSKFNNLDKSEKSLEELILNRAKALNDQALQDVRDDINDVMDDVVYKIEFNSSKGFTFKNGNIDTVLTVKVYRGSEDITPQVTTSGFIWSKYDQDGVLDQAWTTAHANAGRQVVINSWDVYQKATFQVSIDI